EKHSDSDNDMFKAALHEAAEDYKSAIQKQEEEDEQRDKTLIDAAGDTGAANEEHLRIDSMMATAKAGNKTNLKKKTSFIRHPRHRDVVGLKYAAKKQDRKDHDRPHRKEFLAAHPFFDNKKETVEEQEKRVRKNQVKNPIILMVLGFYAAFKVTFVYLINLETLLSCALSIGLTLYWYDYGIHHEGWNGSSMDYVILAFAVTSPLASAIGMAYSRREAALVDIADFRSFASQLYIAHSLWDWDENGGRAQSNVDLRAHSDAVLAQIVGIGDELSRYLTLPTTSRSIHRMTRTGKRQAAATVEVAYRLLESMSHRVTRLSVYGERIKAAGLPSGEVSRIRQYERFIEDCIEKLRMIKMYRTPQAFRSFARIFTFVLPPFYAPTYAQVAIDVQSLGMGIAFSIITALGLTALFESLQVLEDPFVGFLALDGIDVREEFQVLLWHSLVRKRRDIFPDAPPYPIKRRRALTAAATSNLEEDRGNERPHPPSVLAFKDQFKDGDDVHSQASSLTDVAGTTSRPGTAHGTIEVSALITETESHEDSADAAEFGGLLDEDDVPALPQRGPMASAEASTAGSYVRASNFKLFAPPPRDTDS
ncbi:MAG: hypothetical protein SGILL_007397, partial [Bacillariaceae sp.]